MTGILFYRGKTSFEDDIQALAVLAHAVSRGPEVKELYMAVHADHDIVRSHISVDDSL